MIVLGFDPGTNETGWAMLDVRGGRGRPLSVAYCNGGKCASNRGAVMALLDLSKPGIVAVEWIEGVAFAPKGGGVVSSLIATGAVQGGIAWSAEGAGIRVERMSARTWRGMVCGKANAGDALVKDVLPRVMRGLPKITNVHVRDACGVVIGVAWLLSGEKRAA